MNLTWKGVFPLSYKMSNDIQPRVIIRQGCAHPLAEYIFQHYLYDLGVYLKYNSQLETVEIMICQEKTHHWEEYDSNLLVFLWGLLGQPRIILWPYDIYHNLEAWPPMYEGFLEHFPKILISKTVFDYTFM